MNIDLCTHSKWTQLYKDIVITWENISGLILVWKFFLISFWASDLTANAPKSRR